RGQIEADPLVAKGIGDRRGHGSGDGDRLRDALDRQLTRRRDLAFAVKADVRGREDELRVPLGVEEVGRLEVRGEALVPDVHARNLCVARKRAAVAVDGQLAADVVELALERPGEIGDLEVDARMNGVEAPG